MKDLKEMIKSALTRKANPAGLSAEEIDGDSDRETIQPNRQDLRRATRQVSRAYGLGPSEIHDVIGRGPRAHIRRKTGSPPWWKEMKLKSQMRRALQSLKVRNLETVGAHICDKLIAAGIFSVYDLSQARKDDLAGIRGLGPATLNKIRKELEGRGIEVKW